MTNFVFKAGSELMRLRYFIRLLIKTHQCAMRVRKGKLKLKWKIMKWTE